MIEHNKETLDVALSIMEATYFKMMKKNPNYSDMDDISLIQTIFPEYWRNSSNYDLKMKLLSDAIKNKKNLMEFPEITAFEEGVITGEDS